MNKHFIKYLNNFHIYQSIETPIQSNELLSNLIKSSLKLKYPILVAQKDVNEEDINNIDISKMYLIQENMIYLATRSTCFFKNSYEKIKNLEELALFLKKKSL